TPRIFATERVEQLMPQFDLADEDIRELRLLLAGFRERKVAPRYQANQGTRVVQTVEGRRLMHQYNCIGCHEIEGRGGVIRKNFQEKPTLPPPHLHRESAEGQHPTLFY